MSELTESEAAQIWEWCSKVAAKKVQPNNVNAEYIWWRLEFREKWWLGLRYCPNYSLKGPWLAVLNHELGLGRDQWEGLGREPHEALMELLVDPKKILNYIAR